MEQNMIIDMSHIVKSFTMGQNQLEVLKGISLQIQKGEFVAILGPSGSGKSTLMNIIGCIDVPDSGQYFLGGESINKKSEKELARIRNREIGFVFQKFNLLPKLTAVQNVELPLLLRGTSRKEAHEKGRSVLARVGLEDRMDHKPMELSGGQQQRVSIARALVGEPTVILADEPTGALDTKTGKEIINLFLELNLQGHTIVLITHDEEIAKQAQRIIYVRDGNIE